MIEPGRWLYVNLLGRLLYEGKKCSPGGTETLELENAHIDFIAPEHTLLLHPARKLNMAYIAGEFCWYLRGDLNDTAIEQYSKFWSKIKSNEPPYWNSNYGKYIFTDGQFHSCVSILSKDKDSRNACIVLNNADMLSTASSDKICTNAIMFRIRDSCLNMTVQMRSNDIMLGLCIDAPIFSLIHQMMTAVLRRKYNGLRVGNYHHTSGSLHLYGNKYDMAKEITSSPFADQLDISIPRIHGPAEADILMQNMPTIERRIRENRVFLDQLSLDFYIMPLAYWLQNTLVNHWRDKYEQEAR